MSLEFRGQGKYTKLVILKFHPHNFDKISQMSDNIEIFIQYRSIKLFFRIILREDAVESAHRRRVNSTLPPHIYLEATSLGRCAR